MIPVREALDRIYTLVQPVGRERVSLLGAAGRVLATPAIASRDQPPVTVSSMDGYAVRSADLEKTDLRFRLVGELRAGGEPKPLCIGQGEAARIYTGAPLPPGADHVIIQEQVSVESGFIMLNEPPLPSTFVRPAGMDFLKGYTIEAPRRLAPADISMIAAMNLASVEVYRKPRVAIMPTGDELRMPGEDLQDHQVVASNAFGLQAMLNDAGCDARVLPIAGDSLESLLPQMDDATGSDLIVTIGGASVGNFDMVCDAAESRGLELVFRKVNMRPGKPTFAGRLGDSILIGLPGNPVSALVCGIVFVRPVVAAMQGLDHSEITRKSLPLVEGIHANGEREHYARASLTGSGTGMKLKIHNRQDSSLLSVLRCADALAVRPANDPERAEGELIEFLPLAGILN